MLQLSRDNTDSNRILAAEEFFKDLKWFQVLLRSYNCVTFYQRRPLHKHIYLDASLEGLGG